MAKITLKGFYDFMQYENKDLFEKLSFPAGIDKETVCDNILLRGGEFEVIYSDPMFLYDAFGVWSKKWARTFQKWVDALAIEYAPLENYDRMEDWTEKNTGTVTNDGNSTGRSESNDDSNGNSNTTTDNTVSAFNSNIMEPDTGSESNNHTTNSSNTVASATNRNFDKRTDDLLNRRTGRAHGNIGVTTSQQMLLSELDEAAVWNLYDHITDVFLQEFVIAIY